MSNLRFIDSPKNPQVREITLIKEKSRWRRKSGQFVVEGRREVEMALKGGFILTQIFFFADIINENEILDLLNTYNSSAEVIEVSKEVYKRIAYREKTEGIVALGQSKKHLLEELEFRNKNPLILIAESIEKPGNVGALLRTADAASLDAVIIANPLTDLYNPNILRSSLGCLFTVPIAQANNQAVMDFLRTNQITSFCAELTADKSYCEMDYESASAIVVGPESSGLSKDWLEFADHCVIIPMQGEIDSMNVSVSAAIIIFEALRQRTFNS